MAYAMDLGSGIMIRPASFKHQASSFKLQAPDPEGIRKFFQEKKI